MAAVALHCLHRVDPADWLAQVKQLGEEQTKETVF